MKVGGNLTNIINCSNDPSARPVELAELVELLDKSGGLPTVSELDPYLLGATPSEFGGAGRSGRDDPYVPRTHKDVDSRLAAALRGDRLLLLVGQSKAGKTRSLFEAVRYRLPNAKVLVPTPESLSRVPACPEFVDSDDTIVVWLENLDRFLITGKPLTPGLLTRLTARSAPTVVVATLRREARDRLRGSGEELAYDTRTVLEHATQVELAPTSDDPREHAAAAAAYPTLNLGGHGLAEILAGAPELLRRYDDARYGNPVLHFVIQVAIDWARIGHPSPIPEPTLADLTLRTIEDQRPELDISPEEVGTAIITARTPPHGVGRVAALITHRLPDRSRAYRPFDYLVAADDGAAQHHSSRPIPDDFWDAATRNADATALISVSIAARFRGRIGDAECLVRRAADTGATDAMALLAILLHERGEEAEAGIWYRRAADAGDTDAMGSLGSLLQKRGAEAEAEIWYRRAADTGNARAMSFLGILLQDRGEEVEAEAWYRRAANAGNTRAMSLLGILLQGRDEEVEAEAWYRRAVDTGDTGAMRLLGILLRERGEEAEAKVWYRRAADAGDTHAMGLLGILLQGRGEEVEAEAWYRRAADAGNTRAMSLLGILLQGRDEEAEAEAWYRRAAATGDARAMSLLGSLLQDRGEEVEAEAWYRRAVDTGDTNAMALLGSLLQERGDEAEAEVWYRRAVDAGDTDAMRWLGILLQRGSSRAEAEVWYRRAAAAGDTDAMALLGSLLQESGEEAEAEVWYHRATDAKPTGFYFESRS
ncbi:tetratricopeptide repeat protein [Nocardia gamkensis]|uniref:tetratricopeptide repeat protein n=1 Tax=Nocardia gamkensis TaxID=352869 RepID=UPI0036ECC9CE